MLPQLKKKKDIHMFKKKKNRRDLLISPVVSLGFRVKKWQLGRKETR